MKKNVKFNWKSTEQNNRIEKQKKRIPYTWSAQLNLISWLALYVWVFVRCTMYMRCVFWTTVWTKTSIALTFHSSFSFCCCCCHCSHQFQLGIRRSMMKKFFRRAVKKLKKKKSKVCSIYLFYRNVLITKFLLHYKWYVFNFVKFPYCSFLVSFL